MKKLLCIQIIALIFILANCTSVKKNPLEGAWVCVAQKYISPTDTLTGITPSEKYIKLITKTYFISVYQDTSKKESTLSCGKYTFDGKVYTETFECFTNPEFIGHSISYTSNLNGKNWEITGTYKMKEWGVADYDYEAYEVWEKIE